MKPDRILCLSLERRTDRRALLLRDVAQVPWMQGIEIEFFQAFTPDTCLVPGSWQHKPSYYATNLGHLRMLEKLWLEGCHLALILEDDAQFLESFSRLPDWLDLLNKERPDWLAAFLGGHFQRTPIQVAGHIYQNHGSTQCHAYVVNRPGIWRLYDHLWCCQHDIVDWAYSHMMGQDACCYAPIPWMATTRAGWSDNGGHAVSEGQ